MDSPPLTFQTVLIVWSFNIASNIWLLYAGGELKAQMLNETPMPNIRTNVQLSTLARYCKTAVRLCSCNLHLSNYSNSKVTAAFPEPKAEANPVASSIVPNFV
ncbi:hypothetical protein D3C72_1385610 [compost metagenome]